MNRILRLNVLPDGAPRSSNLDALSSAYPLGQGKLETSPWARIFLDTFVIGSLALPTTH
ncbi:MAG: hypothetical protein M3P26_18010 [Gemmatimonadota bacterium]|nr:hypothetical protein [Gemmatimonadota bacterium]